MPIVHTCKACGCSVSEAEVLAGTSMRRGKSIYCAECSALILEPVEATSGAAGQGEPILRKLEQKPKISAQPVSAAPPRPAPVPVPVPKVSAPQPIADNDGIEIVDEYEILSPSAPEEDLSAALDDEEDDEEDAAEKASEPAPKVGAPRRGSRLAKKRGGPSASATRKPSQRLVKAGDRDRPSRSKIPISSVKALAKKDSKSGRQAAAEAAKGNKEVFFKSSSMNRKEVAQEIEDAHANSVDSNVLQSVRESHEKKRKGAGHSEKNIRRAESQTSNRSRRSVAVRGGGSNSTPMILGIIGCIAIVAILAFFLTGSTTPGSKTATKQVDEDNMSAAECMQRAEDALHKSPPDKIKAADLYARAAEIYQRQGNLAEAQRCNQAAYGLRFKTAY